jgi:hypothetical protein
MFILSASGLRCGAAGLIARNVTCTALEARMRFPRTLSQRQANSVFDEATLFGIRSAGRVVNSALVRGQ